MSDTAKVKVGASLTVNLGNYESAKIEAGIELPCLAEPEEIRQKYLVAWSIVEQELQKKAAEVRGGQNGSK